MGTRSQRGGREAALSARDRAGVRFADLIGARAQWAVSESAPGVSVTIDPTARRYLATALDTRTQVLVLTRGSYGPQREPRWVVSECDWSQIPPKAAKYCCITRLGGLTVIIPQKSLLRELGGRVLRARQGSLSLD